MSFSAPAARPLILLVATEGPATNPSCKSKAAGISSKYRRAQALWGGGSQEGALTSSWAHRGPGWALNWWEGRVVTDSCRLEGGRRLETSIGCAVRPLFSSYDSSHSHTFLSLDCSTCGMGRRQPPGRPLVRHTVGTP